MFKVSIYIPLNVSSHMVTVLSISIMSFQRGQWRTQQSNLWLLSSSTSEISHNIGIHCITEAHTALITYHYMNPACHSYVLCQSIMTYQAHIHTTLKKCTTHHGMTHYLTRKSHHTTHHSHFTCISHMQQLTSYLLCTKS